MCYNLSCLGGHYSPPHGVLHEMLLLSLPSPSVRFQVSMAQSSTHPLKSKWFLFYHKVNDDKNAELMEGDYVTTVEEVFSALKALPDVTLLSPGDSISFSRDKVEPKFESFPNGYRVTLYARSKMQLEIIVPRVVAAVVGESLLKDFAGEESPLPEAGVIRLTHKPHRVYPESSSIDVWFPNNKYMDRVDAYFKELAKPASGVGVTDELWSGNAARRGTCRSAVSFRQLPSSAAEVPGRDLFKRSVEIETVIHLPLKYGRCYRGGAIGALHAHAMLANPLNTFSLSPFFFVAYMVSITAWHCVSSPAATMDVMESSAGLLSLLMGSAAVTPSAAAMGGERLFILLPGNPCIVECYSNFAQMLADSHRCDVLVLGFAGHSLTPHNGRRVFSLQDQIDLCDSFFAQLLRGPKSSVAARYRGHVCIAGHSIGGFVALQMLSRFEKEVKMFFGLAPVLSYIKASPNGGKIAVMDVPLLQNIAALVGSAVGALPLFARRLVTRSYASLADPELREELLRRVHRSQLHNVLYMTKDELRMVKKPDWPMLRALQHKMVLYYVPGDGWAPENHAEEIRLGCPKLKSWIMEKPEAGVAHAWCLKHNAEVLNAIAPYL
eukprot:gene9161-6441_t